MNDDIFSQESLLSKSGDVVIHIVTAMLFIYSAYHGINASRVYAGGGTVIPQIVGILIIEAVLIGLHIMYFTGKISGREQITAFYATYAMGIVLITLGIVSDSVHNAGRTLPQFLAFYLDWVLPFSPVLMAVGAIITQGLSPDKIQARAKAQMMTVQDMAMFKAGLRSKQGAFKAEIIVQEVEADAKIETAKQIREVYKGDVYQDAVKETAEQNIRHLMRRAGILLPENAPPQLMEEVPVTAFATMAADSPENFTAKETPPAEVSEEDAANF